MEILALLAGILAAIVYVAEKLAFYAMLYMLGAFAWRVSRPLRSVIGRYTASARTWIEREFLILSGRIHLWTTAFETWRRLRILRRQFAMGATP